LPCTDRALRRLQQEGSTAKHTAAKQYGAALAKNPALEQSKPPAPTLADWATGRARQMQEAHRADVDAYTRLVEQARAEALLGKNARAQQSWALATLRGQVSEFQGAKAEAARLVRENRKLVLELTRQRKYSDDQLAAAEVHLKQAAANLKAQLSVAGFWKREGEAARAEADDLRELLSVTLKQETSAARPGR
jgi:regulator of replication initiation timing